jgi:hypothetical protein
MVVVAIVTGAGIGFAQPPPNDECAAAKQILATDLPYQDSIATANATTAASDPIQTCVREPSQHENSVWYSFTAQSAVRVVVERSGATTTRW